jgi:hypothetical protein
MPGWLMTRNTPSRSSICQRFKICPATGTLAPSTRSPPGSEMSTTSMVDDCPSSQLQLGAPM